MIPDNITNTIYFSELLKIDKRFSKTYNEIEAALDLFGIQPKFLKKTKDIWARDYMPIQIADDRFVEYNYNPNYLKNISGIKTNPKLVCDSINLKTIKSDLIIDGGNIVKSENCIILTNKVFSENKHTYNEKELLNQLYNTFEVDKVVIFPWDENEIYGHSDGVLRFID
jgi:agmatine/peptidylarginine deiminase